MKIIKVVLIIFAVAILSLVVISILPSFINKSFIDNGTFVSTGGHFKFAVPSSMALGGKHSMTNHSVSFTNDWCELYRVDYGKIPDNEMPFLVQHGRKKFEEYFMRDVYLRMFLQPRLPEGKIRVDFVEYQPNLHGGSLYAQLDVPNGSVCEIRENGAPARREDAKRAILVIILDQQTYVVTTALSVASTGAGNAGTSALSKKTWNNSLRDELKSQTLEFAKTIQFSK